nr:immunoglobulin light chain junction region [Macaca mulatta]
DCHCCSSWGGNTWVF